MGWYITILQEMRDQLGLKGNELIVYAFLNGYSQGGNGCYHGSLATLQGVCGIASRQTAIDVLKSLVEKGFITKSETVVNGVKYVSYAACPKIGQGVQKMDMGCPEIGHNNKRDIDISSFDKEDNSPVRFPFKKSLIDLGVSEEVADAWMAVRKKKRATNSEIAFNAIRREINLAGLTPDQAIRISVEKSWCGFDHSWIEKERKVAPKKESVFEQNLRNLDTMFGTNYHEQAYGNNQMNSYDEQ